MRIAIVGNRLARYMLFLAVFYLSTFLMCSSVDRFIETIGKGFFISSRDNQTLVSPSGRFELGFFRPETRSIPGLFLGIWYYNFDPRTVVWVANRDKPVYGLGYFEISEDGNLVVRDGEGSSSRVCFSTSLDRSLINRTAILLDTGNLVLREDGSGKYLWESFFHPTDTFLPGMKMSETLKLRSWTSQDDPASNNFVFKLDDNDKTSPIIQNGSVTHWVSGESNKFIDSQLPPTVSSLLWSNFRNHVSPRKSALNITISSNLDYNYTRLVLNSSGQFQLWNVTSVGKKWDLKWSAPKGDCEIYKFCGNFGSCNNVSKCKCLPGFETPVPDDFSNGCISKPGICKGNNTFLNLMVTKVNDPDPNFEGSWLNSSQCEEKCRPTCHCLAYSFNNRQRVPTCWIWTSELYDLEEAYGNSGHNLHVRVVASDISISNAGNSGISIAGKSKKFSDPILATFIKVVIAIAVIILFILVGGTGFYFYKRRTRTRRRESRESGQSNRAVHLFDTERRVKALIDSGEFKEEDKKGIGVPFFELESILEATGDFSNANKLGEGGFGPVYKGNFFGGQEMAVKRLSSHSVQGLEEFKNEVLLIAKLQHRNLVRLLGYCVMGNEKILLYEYMPNRSLDAFIFDRTLCMLLDWEKRFDIILGVARGLLYLHQDSRLRIIHRDLKTSNILLDEEMNPKISDFGLARIVEGKETQANTTRVVGTYGYMAPEYALDGLFSIKSDVFSFGVILLEIVSGKRNTGFYRSQQALHLLGYTWGLWREQKPLDLMDQAILKSCNRDEVMRCITVGLLCVQGDPSNRPNMSNALFMLDSEAATLPTPKEPAFIAKKWIAEASSSSSSKPESYSNVELTVSWEGR